MLTSLSLKQTYHKVQNSGAFWLLKLVGGFQNPAFPVLSRQKHSAYMLSYWLLFFGNQEQAGQKCNKWVENLVLIENETRKPQANNAQLSKKQAHEDQKANLPSASVSKPHPGVGSQELFPLILPLWVRSTKKPGFLNDSIDMLQKILQKMYKFSTQCPRNVFGCCTDHRAIDRLQLLPRSTQ